MLETEDDIDAAEYQSRVNLLLSPIRLQGTIQSQAGNAIEGAVITVLDCSIETVTTDEGLFDIELGRHNRILRIEAHGYRPEIVVANVARPVDHDSLELEPIVLRELSPNSTRFLFAGDVAFARRFLDPQEQASISEIPTSPPEALIDTSSPLEGTRQSLAYVAALFETVDFPIVNFESPAISVPKTPHPNKAFVFFSLPESLPALAELGIRYVTLGNNHVYDYLEQGIIDTLSAFATTNIDTSGAGINAETAIAPFVAQLGAHSYALFGMTSVAGSQSPPIYVADLEKGGAADLRDDDLITEAFQAAIDLGHFPIAQLHTGKEYSYTPSDYAYERIQFVAESGASLVIGHHPHVAQGFSFENDVLTVHSLGNFCFDQERLETMLGLVALVDQDGATTSHATAQPIYLEDFRPRLIAGSLADQFLRRVGRASNDRGGLAYPFGQHIEIPRSPDDFVTVESHITIDVTVGPNEWAAVDLREWTKPGQWLSKATVLGEQPIALQLGEDLLLHGDFEDHDVDEKLLEASRWDFEANSRYICTRNAYRGLASGCMKRSDSNSDDSVLPFRNRIRVLGNVDEDPNKNLTLFGYHRQDNAGATSILARYYASDGPAEFGEEVLVQRSGGDTQWESFASDIHMPPGTFPADNLEDNPRALRLFVRHSPPHQGEGLYSLDELAVISWEVASSAIAIESPNPSDFIRVSAEPGSYQLELTFKQRYPAHLSLGR